MLALLVHCKRYGDENYIFDMSYKQMAELNCTINSYHLCKYLKILEEENMIEIIARQKDFWKARSNLRQTSDRPVNKLSNIYKCNIVDETANGRTLLVTKDSDVNVCKFLAEIFTIDELRKLGLPKRAFYKIRSEMLKANINHEADGE